MSPTTKIARMARHGQRRLGQHAAGAVERHAERLRRAATPPRPRPTAQSAPRSLVAIRRPPRRSRQVTPVDPRRSRGSRCAPRRPAASAIAARPRASGSGNAPSTCGPPSTSTMRADSGRMLRKSCRSVWRAISASAPASSTPVGRRRRSRTSAAAAAPPDPSPARPLRTPAAPAAGSPGHRRASSALARAPPTRGGRSTRASRRSRRSDSRTVDVDRTPGPPSEH